MPLLITSYKQVLVASLRLNAHFGYLLEQQEFFLPLASLACFFFFSFYIQTQRMKNDYESIILNQSNQVLSYLILFLLLVLDLYAIIRIKSRSEGLKISSGSTPPTPLTRRSATSTSTSTSTSPSSTMTLTWQCPLCQRGGANSQLGVG